MGRGRGRSPRARGGNASRRQQLLAHLLEPSPLTGQLAISRETPRPSGWIPSSAHSRAASWQQFRPRPILYLRSWDELAGSRSGTRHPLTFMPSSRREKILTHDDVSNGLSAFRSIPPRGLV